MTVKNKPLVSVIIATKNAADTVRVLLISIARQTFTAIEIIVVDNFSTDRTRLIATDFTKHVYLCAGERSRQRNFGAKKARGKYLLFLDADMELNPLTIKDCVKVSLTIDASGVVIPEDVRVTSFFSRMKRLEKHMYWNEPLIEAARFIKKHVFFEAGGYNETMIAGEDWDLAQRVAQKGKISRIDRPLYHQEISAWRELRHKMYYTNNIHTYALVHPEQFKQQSGKARVHLFLRKTHFFREDPLAFMGLILFKGIEYTLYISALIYNKLC